MTALAGRSSRPTQRCIEPTRQLSDPASTRRCRRIAPEDVHDCRVREVHPTVDLIGAPAPGGTLDRSCGMGCRPKDVLDLRGVRDWMEKGGSRGRHRCPGGMAGGNTPSISRVVRGPKCRPGAIPDRFASRSALPKSKRRPHGGPRTLVPTVLVFKDRQYRTCTGRSEASDRSNLVHTERDGHWSVGHGTTP